MTWQWEGVSGWVEYCLGGVRAEAWPLIGHRGQAKGLSFPEAVGMQDRVLLGIVPVWGPGWLAEWSEALGLGSLEHPTPVLQAWQAEC